MSNHPLHQEQFRQSARVSANTSFLSPCNTLLNDYVKSHPAAATETLRRIDAETVPTGFDAHYEVVPWPLVLSQDRIADFKQLVDVLPRIATRAVKNFFDADVHAFCEYFDSSEHVYRMLMESPLQPEGIICRHDVLYSGNELKLLEMNAGSNIGGWELDWLHHETLKAISSVESLSGKEIAYRRVITAMTDALAKAVKALNKHGKTGHLLFRVADMPKAFERMMIQYIQSQYQASSDYRGGQVFFSTDLNGMRIGTGHEVFFQGHEIDAVLLLDTEIPERVYRQLDIAHSMQQIVFPDSAVHNLIGSKTLMALLHEEQAQAFLDEQQSDWVQRHVPWTVRTNQPTVRWNGDRHPLSGLLSQHKDRFVLKKSESLQGRDVFIGAHTETDEWNELVARLSARTGWIAQEFCPSDTIFSANSQSQTRAIIPVLAAFGFGGLYGGSVGRGVPVERDQGVVNLSRGAEVYVLLEDRSPDPPSAPATYYI